MYVGEQLATVTIMFLLVIRRVTINKMVVVVVIMLPTSSVGYHMPYGLFKKTRLAPLACVVCLCLPNGTSS